MLVLKILFWWFVVGTITMLVCGLLITRYREKAPGYSDHHREEDAD